MTETYGLTRKIYIQAQPETIFSYLTIEAKMKVTRPHYLYQI